jgi:hypothetical protein
VGIDIDGVLEDPEAPEPETEEDIRDKEGWEVGTVEADWLDGDVSCAPWDEVEENVVSFPLW